MDIYQILESLKRVEESMSEADLLIQDIVNGRVDIYDVYAHPKDEVEKYVSEIIHNYYDEVVIDTGLHAKDDFEPIFDRVVDQLQKDYNVEFDESSDDDDGSYADDPKAHASVNRGGHNKLNTLSDYYAKLDAIDQALQNPKMAQFYPEYKQRRLDLEFAARRAGLIKEGGKFSFANAKQKPGDQVRGTEKATKKKSGAHPFAGRLVGTDESKLDEKCWDGYQQQGMKKKGDRQVPNCVPVEEEYEAYMNELVGTYGMTSGGTATGGNTKTNTQAGQEIDTITKNLQNLKSKVPDLNIQKATAALSKADNDDSLSSQDKDAASALADPVANLIKDPQLGQQLKQLIDKGMQKDQAAAQLAKQQGGV